MFRGAQHGIRHRHRRAVLILEIKIVAADVGHRHLYRPAFGGTGSGAARLLRGYDVVAVDWPDGTLDVDTESDVAACRESFTPRAPDAELGVLPPTA